MSGPPPPMNPAAGYPPRPESQGGNAPPPAGAGYPFGGPGGPPSARGSVGPTGAPPGATFRPPGPGPQGGAPGQPGFGAPPPRPGFGQPGPGGPPGSQPPRPGIPGPGAPGGPGIPGARPPLGPGMGAPPGGPPGGPPAAAPGFRPPQGPGQQPPPPGAGPRPGGLVSPTSNQGGTFPGGAPPPGGAFRPPTGPGAPPQMRTGSGSGSAGPAPPFGAAPPAQPGFAARPPGGAPAFGAAPGGASPQGQTQPGAPAPGFPGAQTSPPPPSGGGAGVAGSAHRARRAYAPVDSFAGSGGQDFGAPAGGQPPPPFGAGANTGLPAGVPPMVPPPGAGGNQFMPPPGPTGVAPRPGMPPAQPAANQFIQPARPPTFGSGAPAGAAPPGNAMGGVPNAGMAGAGPGLAGQPGGVTQLAGQFQNMNVAGGNLQPNQPNPAQAINVLQRPVEVFEFDQPEPTSWMSSQLSVSQSPTSNCDPVYKRCTINSIPQGPNLLNKSRLPFGLLITPYRHQLPGEEPVPVINPPQIVRCRRCRTYINPWVQFVEQGTRWKCNMCFLTNEVPNFFDWDTETRSHVDRMKRAELTHAVVEYVAPQEYMVRPPQPVVMLFVIDVSTLAVQSGMLAVAAKSILASLDGIPNTDNRAKIGFITVDSSLHFYNLSSSLTEPQMLVVSDIDDIFLPLPYDLLVPLTESRAVIERLLNQLPEMFAQNQSTYNVLGRALQAAHKMIAAIGGKIIVLQSTLPNVSEGCLKSREDPKLLGTAKEVTLLQPSIAFYKNLAVDCSRSQVSIDVFFFNSNYADVATLSGCAKFTGGSVFYYPNFNAQRNEDVIKVTKEMQHFLSRPIGLEAVLRVRASKGIKMTAFHGNFFLRSTDLLALPNVSPDNSYAIEMSIQDVLTSNVACFQTALLHTSSNGERRIRVLTLAIPVTNNLADVFASADQFAIAALLAKKGIERSLISKIEDAREAIAYKLNEMIAAYRCAFSSSGQSGQVILPKNLKLLPILTLGLIKSTAFRATNMIPSDLRSYAMAMMYVYPTELCLLSIHPRFYALHVMDPKVGLPDENDKIVLPPLLNLSSEKLERHGLFLLDNGTEIFIWVGRNIAPELCQMVFDKPSYDVIPVGKVILPTLKNEASQRIANIINRIKHYRLLTMTLYPHVYVVKEDGDPSLRMWFLTHLIEDRIESGHSYTQFLQVVRENKMHEHEEKMKKLDQKIQNDFSDSEEELEESRTVILTELGMDIISLPPPPALPPLPKAAIRNPSDWPVYSPSRHKALPPTFSSTKRLATASNTLALYNEQQTKAAFATTEKMLQSQQSFARSLTLRYKRVVDWEARGRHRRCGLSFRGRGKLDALRLKRLEEEAAAPKPSQIVLQDKIYPRSRGRNNNSAIAAGSGGVHSAGIQLQTKAATKTEVRSDQPAVQAPRAAVTPVSEPHVESDGNKYAADSVRLPEKRQAEDSTAMEVEEHTTETMITERREEGNEAQVTQAEDIEQSAPQQLDEGEEVKTSHGSIALSLSLKDDEDVSWLEEERNALYKSWRRDVPDEVIPTLSQAVKNDVDEQKVKATVDAAESTVSEPQESQAKAEFVENGPGSRSSKASSNSLAGVSSNLIAQDSSAGRTSGLREDEQVLMDSNTTADRKDKPHEEYSLGKSPAELKGENIEPSPVSISIQDMETSPTEASPTDDTQSVKGKSFKSRAAKGLKKISKIFTSKDSVHSSHSGKSSSQVHINGDDEEDHDESHDRRGSTSSRLSTSSHMSKASRFSRSSKVSPGLDGESPTNETKKGLSASLKSLKEASKKIMGKSPSISSMGGHSRKGSESNVEESPEEEASPSPTKSGFSLKGFKAKSIGSLRSLKLKKSKSGSKDKLDSSTSEDLNADTRVIGNEDDDRILEAEEDEESQDDYRIDNTKELPAREITLPKDTQNIVSPDVCSESEEEAPHTFSFAIPQVLQEDSNTNSVKATNSAPQNITPELKPENDLKVKSQEKEADIPVNNLTAPTSQPDQKQTDSPPHVPVALSRLEAKLRAETVEPSKPEVLKPADTEKAGNKTGSVEHANTVPSSTVLCPNEKKETPTSPISESIKAKPAVSPSAAVSNDSESQSSVIVKQTNAVASAQGTQGKAPPPLPSVSTKPVKSSSRSNEALNLSRASNEAISASDAGKPSARELVRQLDAQKEDVKEVGTAAAKTPGVDLPRPAEPAKTAVNKDTSSVKVTSPVGATEPGSTTGKTEAATIKEGASSLKAATSPSASRPDLETKSETVQHTDKDATKKTVEVKAKASESAPDRKTDDVKPESSLSSKDDDKGTKPAQPGGRFKGSIPLPGLAKSSTNVSSQKASDETSNSLKSLNAEKSADNLIGAKQKLGEKKTGPNDSGNSQSSMGSKGRLAGNTISSIETEIGLPKANEEKVSTHDVNVFASSRPLPRVAMFMNAMDVKTVHDNQAKSPEAKESRDALASPNAAEPKQASTEPQIYLSPAEKERLRRKEMALKSNEELQEKPDEGQAVTEQEQTHKSTSNLTTQATAAPNVLQPASTVPANNGNKPAAVVETKETSKPAGSQPPQSAPKEDIPSSMTVRASLKGVKCEVKFENFELNCTDKGKPLKHFFPIEGRRIIFAQADGEEVVVHACVTRKKNMAGSKLKKLKFVFDDAGKKKLFADMIMTAIYGSVSLDPNLTRSVVVLIDKFDSKEASKVVEKHMKPVWDVIQKVTDVKNSFANGGEIEKLIELADRGMAMGRAIGGPSIFDLASGAVTYEDKFISAYQRTKGSFLSPEEWNFLLGLYRRIEDKVREVFQVQETDHLTLGRPSFFSKIDNSEPRSVHDDYTHMHVDRDQYGTFCYTGLLYLSTAGDDFTGGNFIWYANNSEDSERQTLMPRAGRLSLFSSGSENPHRVTRVLSGLRRGL
ncbi:COPII subunit [Phlyctochytrium bullatum]|nr:COPII subunit [Phlyctochytrium bullatum]